MTLNTFGRWLSAMGAALVLALPAVQAHADAGSLRAKYQDLREELRNNSFQRQLFIDSAEGANALQGDVYAVLEHPLERVKGSLQDANAWCDIMLLPFNTKYCHAGDNQLAVRIGRKSSQPVELAYKIDFRFQNAAATGDYFDSRLTAAQGPLGTRDYRIRVEAVALDASHTFMHLSYAYGYGTAGRIAMGAYLSTIGASKVGFSQSREPGEQGQLIGGVRGAIERNAMRYYLAIDAYLDSLATPEAQRVDRRIDAWFTATERYPRQLHEMDRAAYVQMKKAEYDRQKTAALS